MKPNKNFRQNIAKKILGTFGLRFVSTGLGFVTSILFARLLGVTEFGIYAYTISWVRFLTLPATLGFDNLLVKDIAAYNTQSAWGLMKGLLKWSSLVVLFLSTILALVAVSLAWVINKQSDPLMFWSFSLAMFLLPIGTARNLRMAAMRGLHRNILGLFPELILAPLLIIVFTTLLYFIKSDNLTAIWVVGTHVTASIITLVIGMQILAKALPDPVKNALPEYQVKIWFRNSLPFLFVGSTYLINSQADILMLGSIKGPELVGLYLPATRGAQLIFFVTFAANTVLAPLIADFYSSGNFKKLRQIVSKTTLGAFSSALLMTLGLVVLGRWYLLLFGPEFTQSYLALIILCLGQVMNAATCAVGWLLSMTKYERLIVFTSSFGAILNIILNWFLIPRWGIEGAALATTISLSSVNIADAILVQKKLKVNATILGSLIKS